MYYIQPTHCPPQVASASLLDFSLLAVALVLKEGVREKQAPRRRSVAGDLVLPSCPFSACLAKLGICPMNWAPT